ncbi:MAG TPA: DNA-formamidopyrimidine glycosylase [Candidatus Paceibacterota bacterium]|nr:DNA-formamidopyrimidine glycosylase [Candidatus Paceibacterota bacterium]
MPELPEVETVVRDLRRKVLGRRIKKVWSDAPKLVKKPTYRLFARFLKGARLERVERRGKNILIHLDRGRLLLIHQKMTGHLLVGKWRLARHGGRAVAVSVLPGPLAEPVNQYVHLIFFLDDGRMLGLSDLRKFAKILLGPRGEIEALPDLTALGPEALAPNLTEKDFSARIHKERRRIKDVLLDQRVVAGIGNIYSDDILWLARVHPTRRAWTLSAASRAAIYRAMRKLLARSIVLRGASMSDFRDTAGRPGGYGPVRLVYQRDGAPCLRCGTPIRHLKVGSRTARYCPKCQKPPKK